MVRSVYLKEGRVAKSVPKIIIRSNLPRVTTKRAGVTPIAMIPASGKIPFPTFRKKHSFNQHDWWKLRWHSPDFSTTSDKWPVKTDVEFTSLKTFSSNVCNTLWKWFYGCDEPRTDNGEEFQADTGSQTKRQPTFNNQLPFVMHLLRQQLDVEFPSYR